MRTLARTNLSRVGAVNERASAMQLLINRKVSGQNPWLSEVSPFVDLTHRLVVTGFPLEYGVGVAIIAGRPKLEDLEKRATECADGKTRRLFFYDMEDDVREHVNIGRDELRPGVFAEWA